MRVDESIGMVIERASRMKISTLEKSHKVDCPEAERNDCYFAWLNVSERERKGKAVENLPES